MGGEVAAARPHASAVLAAHCIMSTLICNDYTPRCHSQALGRCAQIHTGPTQCPVRRIFAEPFSISIEGSVIGWP